MVETTIKDYNKRFSTLVVHLGEYMPNRRKTVRAAKLMDALLLHGFPCIAEVKQKNCSSGEKVVFRGFSDAETLLTELGDKIKNLEFVLYPRPKTQEAFWREVASLQEEKDRKDVFGVPI